MTSSALPAHASIVIVGGGIQGLACAFNLADRGMRDILVLDAGYWQGGASGRNGTLIRAGFVTTEWTRLFAASYREWKGLSRRLRHNVMFSPRSYTVLAERDSTAAMFEPALAVHRDEGVRSSILQRPALARHMPALDVNQVKVAMRLEDGGVAPHHAVMKGYLAACKAAGVELHYRTAVTGFEKTAGKVSAVLVGDHRISTDRVMIAAGAKTVELAAMLDAPVAGYGMRIEAMALEPIRPLIGTGVSLQDSLCYMHQTARGEVVGGAEVAEQPIESLRSDPPTMAATAAVYQRMFPALGEVRVMRHWAGILHISPDFGPVLGPHPTVPGLWVSCGWSYGFTGGPGAGALMAKSIFTGEVDDRIAPFSVDRFDRGRAINEGAINLAKPEDLRAGKVA